MVLQISRGQEFTCLQRLQWLLLKFACLLAVMNVCVYLAYCTQFLHVPVILIPPSHAIRRPQPGTAFIKHCLCCGGSTTQHHSMILYCLGRLWFDKTSVQSQTPLALLTKICTYVHKCMYYVGMLAFQPPFLKPQQQQPPLLLTASKTSPTKSAVFIIRVPI